MVALIWLQCNENSPSGCRHAGCLPDCRMKRAFDSIAETYDLLSDWGKRLDIEIPFLHRILEDAGAKTVLDAACGTGVHLRALAQLGFTVTGSDISPEMVGMAKERLKGITDAKVFTAGFEETARHHEPRDAVLVIGNSLPNAGGAKEVRTAIASLAGALKPGGVMIIHTLNYPKLIREGGGLRPLRRVQKEGREHLFLKLFEIHRDHVALVVISVVKQGEEYSQRLMRSRLFPIDLPWITDALAEAGLSVTDVFGGFSGAPYDEENSGDILLTARHTGGGNDG